MRVLVVNRSRVTLEAWRSFLGADGRISSCAVATDMREAASEMGRNPFDLVLAGRDCLVGGAHTRRDRDHQLRAPRFVLVSHDVSPSTLVNAWVSGFDQVIDSNLPLEEMVSRLVEVAQGTSSLAHHPVIAADLGHLASLRSGTTIAVHDDTDREIVALLSNGLSDKEIADSVFLSCQTVRNRISRLLRDSNLANRTQLAVLHLRSEMELTAPSA